jgi:transaldolase
MEPDRWRTSNSAANWVRSGFSQTLKGFNQGFQQYFQGNLSLGEITAAIVEVTELPVFIQIHGPDTPALVKKALELHKISSRVGFKIIADEKGFQAIAELQKQGINCIATTLFSISQAAVAAGVGAFGICPFISRGLYIGLNMFEILSSIREGYDRLDHPPQIIAVSLKNLADVELALSAGVDAVGMRYPLLKQMMEHTLSRKAELLFAKNWAEVKDEDISYLSHALKLEGSAEDSVH